MGKEQVAKVKAKELVVHPWSMSATGQWDKETGLTELRQYAEGKIPVAEIVDMLWEPGAYVQNSAVAELLQHGNPRQAAVLVKSLVETHPVCEKSLKEWYGDLVDEFLTKPLGQYPSKPEEYPSHVKVRYVQ